MQEGCDCKKSGWHIGISIWYLMGYTTSTNELECCRAPNQQFTGCNYIGSLPFLAFIVYRREG